MAEFASKGVAGTGLGLGIAGTALGLMNGSIGNILNNRCGYNYNNGCGVCSDDHLVTRYEQKMAGVIASKDSEIALLKSEQNTEIKIADVYERLDRQIRALENKVTENTCGQAVTNQQLADNIKFVDNKFADVYKDINAGDERIKCYVDCHFVPGKLIMPLDSICPPAMPLTAPSPKPVKANN